MKILVDALRVRLTRNLVTNEQSLNLAREDNTPAVVMVVELLHPQRIASQCEQIAPLFPERKRENASHFGQAAGAFFL